MGCGVATRRAGGRQRREQKQRSHPRPWRASRVRQRDGVGEGCEKEKDAYGTDGREERVREETRMRAPNVYQSRLAASHHQPGPASPRTGRPPGRSATYSPFGARRCC